MKKSIADKTFNITFFHKNLSRYFVLKKLNRRYNNITVAMIITVSIFLGLLLYPILGLIIKDS